MDQRFAIVKGTLDVLVLKALSWGPMHSFEIATWLADRAAGAVEIDDSALYQALYRMEARGLVSADWGTTDNHRRARYYRHTRAGRAALNAQTSQLLGYAKVLTAILSAAPRTT